MVLKPLLKLLGQEQNRWSDSEQLLNCQPSKCAIYIRRKKSTVHEAENFSQPRRDYILVDIFPDLAERHVSQQVYEVVY